MTVKPLPINAVVAQNLAYWMGRAKIKQSALGEKAGVSQKTVSNYLNPAQRSEGALGKAPSPKLVELDAIATALGVEVWQLTRRMTPAERTMYESIEKAYTELRASASANVDLDQSQAPPSETLSNEPYSKNADKSAGKGLAVVSSGQKRRDEEGAFREPAQDRDTHERSRNPRVPRKGNAGRS